MTDAFKKAIDDIQKALADGVKKNYLADQLAGLDQIAAQQESGQVAMLEDMGMATDEARKSFLQAKKIAEEVLRKRVDKLFG